MLFTPNNINEVSIEQAFSDPDAIIEMLILDEVAHMDPALKKEFFEEGVAEQLVSEGKLRNGKSVMRLSKNDDLTRRTKIFAIQAAKENNDPNYEKLRINRVKERDLIGKIVKRWGHAGEKMAKKSQKEYLNPASSKRVLPAKFLKNRADDSEEQ